MSTFQVLRQNWKAIALGGAIATASISYLGYSYFLKTYPQFASVPGPFKHIGCSYHRIPNNTRFKVYYPTSLDNIKESNSTPPKTYFKDPGSLITLNKQIGIPSFLLNALNDLSNTSNPMPCHLNAPILIKPDVKYPLLLFSHGNTANFDIYAQYCCSLASYGIIVAIIDHTDGSALHTKLNDGKDLFYKPGYLLDNDGNKYKPKPWTSEHDIADFGNQRLKPVRVPEFIELYKYLTKTGMNVDNIKDDKLCDILKMTDLDTLLFGGQSFGGVTSWMANTKISDDRIKCMLLLDPWFGCVDAEELKSMKWRIPAMILSSEVWIKTKKDVMKLTQIVMSNGLSKGSVWEYGKKFTHYDSADVPIWGPSAMTRSRKIYTAQQWSDLISKRSGKFIMDNIPGLQEKLNIDDECLNYDKDCIVTVQSLTPSQL